MQRVRRRWWTWTVSVAALLVILAAGISGLFQLAVMALPDYRDDLSVWVTRVAGRPVQIGGINLVWRGINPRLELSDITLFDEQGEEESLTAQRPTLGFSLLRLVQGDYLPRRAVLSGISLGVRVDAQGRVSVAGFEKPADDRPLDLRKWLREIERFGSVRVERCTIELEDERAGRQKQLRFELTALDVDLSPGGFEAEARIALPALYGETLSIEASAKGPLPEPEQWSGEFSLQASGLMPQPWLRGRVAPGTRVAAEEVELEGDGAFAGGQLTHLNLEIESGALLAVRAGREITAESLQARLQLQRETRGWRAELTRFAVDGEDQVLGQLHYQSQDEGFELNADVQTLRLDRLMPWLQFARELPAPIARAPQASGELSGLVLRLQRQAQVTRYTVRTELRNLALASDGEQVGFRGLSGELSARETDGRLRLQGDAPSLLLPRVFAVDVPFQKLEGQLQWRRLPEGWRLLMPQFDWKLSGSTGRGRLDLLLPADHERSPEIDLSAHFAADDVNAFKPYMPRRWGEGIKGWLQRALEKARVTRGQLLLRGPLREFPFLDGAGEWKLDLDVVQGRLAYAPNWPAADNLNARLRFSGNGLTIDASAATLDGLPVEKLQARIADFRDRLLTIDGSIRGEAAAFYAWLRNSPLRETLSGLISRTRAAGPAHLDLHLDIPLQEAARTAASGRIALDGVQMYYAGLRQPINDIRGEIAFDRDGISAQQLSARFEDLALSARIEPREQTRGVIVAEFPFALRSDGSGVSAFIPAPLRNFLVGQSRWQAELPLASTQAQSQLLLTSDLHGVAVSLPRPLGKSADEPGPLQIALGEDGKRSGLRVRVAYDNRLSADIALAPPPEKASAQATAAEPPAWNTDAISLQLGSGAAVPADEGLHIGGQVAELDVPAWSAAVGGFARGAQGSSGGGLRRIDLQVDKLLLPGQFLRDTRLMYRPIKDGWNLRLAGRGAEGEMFWGPADGGRLSVALARLDLEKLPEPAVKKPAGGSVFNPAQWPVLDLDCTRCTLDGVDFGHIKLNTLRQAEGQALEYFTAQGGKLEANASGEWLRSGNVSSAKLKFDLLSPDLAAVLKSLGYAQTLTAKSSKASGELSWIPATGGIAWEQARGTIGLAFEKGTLKAVDPGAGRVLGLLNFYALPRRLTLDFRDVVRSGLAFDKIGGSFALADGAAVTDNVKIEAPSLRMEMRGRIGLVARDYDQHVSVYPDVSSGITLGAALLGGPALGALAFLAQEVLDKPIEQATHLEYRVTGSWDNPEIKRIDPDVSEAAPAPALVPPPAAPAASPASPSPAAPVRRR